MNTVLGHTLLISTLLVAVALHALTAARRHFLGNGPRQIGFCSIAAGIIAVGATASLFASLLMPDRIVYADAARYYYEIRRIAEAPWLWNPLTGTGPFGYDDTPKMGMSYLYGWILGCFQATSLIGILALNVAFLYITGYAVFLLTLRLSSSATAAAVGMATVGIYPETLFWVIRPARENIALPTVALVAYFGIRLFDTGRLRWMVGLLALSAALLLTRAQLVLFTGLVFTYYGFVVAGRVFFRGNLSGAAFVLAALVAAAVVAPFAAEQIRSAAGSAIFRVMSLDALAVIATAERSNGALRLIPSGYGAAGLLMLPFAVALVALTIGTLIRFSTIFRGGMVPAGMVLLMIIVFMTMLSVLGSINIRFRSTVAPLLIAFMAPGAVYYWRALALPSITLPPKRIAA